MSFRDYSPRKKGGFVGIACAAIISCILFFGFVKLLVIDSWDGISQTAGNDMGNLIWWIFIYGFLALMISVVVFVFLFAVLFSLGSFLGWFYGKIMHRS
jgi:hypothetical protein